VLVARTARYRRRYGDGGGPLVCQGDAAEVPVTVLGGDPLRGKSGHWQGAALRVVAILGESIFLGNRPR
jgi:hypothetical protein